MNQNVFPLADRIVPPHLQAFTTTWSPVYIPETVDGEVTYARPTSTSLSLDYSMTATLESASGWRSGTTFGAQLYVEQDELFANSGQGLASPLSKTINQVAQSRITTTYEFTEDETLGYYVREDLSWKDRIFLSGALSFDDSSTFGVLVPVQTYPSLFATWVVSDEAFWRFDGVDVLRLRAAWGEAGRRPTARSSQPTFVETPGPGGEPTLRPARAANPALGPEVSTELELGFDLSLLDQRLGVTLSRYWRRDERLLLTVPVPVSTGAQDSFEQNLGRIDNWGWEVAVSGRLYEGRALSVDLDLALDHTDNEIKELGRFEATPAIALGLPYPNQITDDWVVSAQFDPAGDRANAFGEAIRALCDEGVSLAPDADAPDAVQYGRVSGGQLRPCQEIPARNLFVGPAFATRAVSVAPRVGLLGDRLQIFALAEGQYGRWSQANDKEWGHIRNNSKVSRLEDDPLWVYGDGVGDDTKRELYDADFWKLRELGVRYALPRSWAEWMGAARASVSLSARNVWTIWRAQSEIYGLRVTDPEYGTPTLDGNGNFWETPPISSLSVTLRATF